MKNKMMNGSQMHQLNTLIFMSKLKKRKKYAKCIKIYR